MLFVVHYCIVGFINPYRTEIEASSAEEAIRLTKVGAYKHFDLPIPTLPNQDTDIISITVEHSCPKRRYTDHPRHQSPP